MQRPLLTVDFVRQSTITVQLRQLVCLDSDDTWRECTSHPLHVVVTVQCYEGSETEIIDGNDGAILGTIQRR